MKERQLAEKEFVNVSPEISLISATENLVPALIVVWENSKLSEKKMMEEYGVPYLTMPDILDYLEKSERYKPEDYQKTLKKIAGIIKASIPVSKNVGFTFEFRNTSTVFRSHLVRHSGITGLWAKSNRLGDLSKFEYYVPHDVRAMDEALEIWLDTMANVRDSYEKLRALGVIEEDARGILPVNHMQTISCNLSLHALAHIIDVRSGWFADEQWVPIIGQMLDEIRNLPYGDIIADGLAPKISIDKHPDEIDTMHRFPKFDDPQGDRVDPLPIDPIMYHILVSRGEKMRPYHEYILPRAMNKTIALKRNLSKVWTGEALEILKTVMCNIDTDMSLEGDYARMDGKSECRCSVGTEVRFYDKYGNRIHDDLKDEATYFGWEVYITKEVK